MSLLADLKSAKSREDIASVLGYSPKGLAFVLYKIPAATKYTSFTIPKKSGGARHIAAPIGQLKSLQARLAALIYACRREIEEADPRKPLSHGFREGLSIITNAHEHTRRRWVFNIDLQDFFPSLNFGRVRGFFIKDKRFGLDPSAATVVAQIACHENALPQEGAVAKLVGIGGGVVSGCCNPNESRV